MSTGGGRAVEVMERGPTYRCPTLGEISLSSPRNGGKNG